MRGEGSAGTGGFEDHFSEAAGDYALFRPAYPPELFRYLASASPSTRRAWDCGCGSGQASVALADHFDEVLATDASPDQIAHAAHRSNIRYEVRPAGRSGLDGASADMVAAAQSIHWFPLERFYAEVNRVLAPGGLLAAWCYGLFTCAPQVDAVVRRLYQEILGPCWPAERALVETRYEDLPWPFDDLDAPGFAMRATWSLDQLCGYVRTWSAVRAYVRRHGKDPVSLVAEDLQRAWGGRESSREIRWPLHLRLGRKPRVRPG